jgi:predicted transposase YbfD/YdcC
MKIPKIIKALDTMERLSSGELLEPFAQLRDPRVERTKKHLLLDVVIIGLLTVLCGGEGWEDMEEFGTVRQQWLQGFLALPNGIPSADTFRRVLSALNPTEFQRCLVRWIETLAGAANPVGRTVPIDGKTLRGSFDTAAAQSPLHLVHAWAAEQGLLLGQVATDAKSNEITAIPALVKTLELKGATVTIDAMGCQKEIATAIVEAQADYVLALKGNQELFHREVVELFDDVVKRGRNAPMASDYHETTDGDHGRIEVRRVWTVSDVSWFSERAKWKNLSSLALVESERTCGGKTTWQRRYFISSLKDASASHLGAVVREHWAIENSLHWCLDVAFREDASRVRRDHGPENLAMLRRVALQLFKRDRTSKRGLAAKTRRAAYDPDYLLSVLLAGLGTI